ncbi:MAG: type II secretion system protein [Candidatus Gastranaerophilales bacterium]
METNKNEQNQCDRKSKFVKLILLRWNASEQRQKAKTTLFALPFNASEARRGGNEVDGVVSMRKRFAFTLAEVLITLGVIGVVSAMTLPSLISNYQSNALEKKQLLFEDRIEEAMNQMRFHEKLTGYSSAEDFVDEFSKYIKINEICMSGELENCFPEEIYSPGFNKYLSLSLDDLATGNDFASATDGSDFSSNNVTVIFADGIHALMNYNKNCEWLDPYSSGANRSEASSCIAMLADLNGNSGKNTIGNDIIGINANFLVCLESGLCVETGDTAYSALNTCTGSEDYIWDTTGDDNLYCAENYWAGAMKACAEKDMDLMSQAQALEVINEMYGVELTSYPTAASLYFGTVSSTALITLQPQTYYLNRVGNDSTASRLHMETMTTTGVWIGTGDTSKNSSNSTARCVQSN